jgi:hypothetical protein
VHPITNEMNASIIISIEKTILNNLIMKMNKLGQSDLLITGIVTPSSEPSTVITLDCWGLSNS